jgi:hypothetical protein
MLAFSTVPDESLRLSFGMVLVSNQGSRGHDPWGLPWNSGNCLNGWKTELGISPRERSTGSCRKTTAGRG